MEREFEYKERELDLRREELELRREELKVYKETQERNVSNIFKKMDEQNSFFLHSIQESQKNTQNILLKLMDCFVKQVNGS